MKSRAEATLTLHDVSRLIWKHWGLLFLGAFFGTTLFTLAGLKMPKKYKVHFVLAINSKYFQSPLIGDFVPELSGSGGETASQRESLIRQVLTPDYLDALADKYGIYGPRKNLEMTPSLYQELRTRLKNWCVKAGLYTPGSQESQLSAAREDLLTRIQIYSLNSTTFNISFVYSDPDITFQVTRDIYAHVIESLLELRVHTLANIRDAIRRQLDTLQSNLDSLPAPSVAALPPPAAEDELAQVRKQLRSLSAEYTDEHPQIKQLKERERILANRLDGALRDDSPLAAGPATPSGQGSGEATRESYSDLTRKYNYLNIAIDTDREHQGDYFATLEAPLFPASALWPKRGLFAAWGFAFGLFGSLFIVALWEYFDRSALHAGVLAQQLGVSLLGQLPVLPPSQTSSPMPILGAPPQKTPGRG